MESAASHVVHTVNIQHHLAGKTVKNDNNKIYSVFTYFQTLDSIIVQKVIGRLMSGKKQCFVFKVKNYRKNT